VAVNRPELITQKNLDSGSVSFQDRNFGQGPTGKAKERRISVTFMTANSPEVVTHTLGKPPTGYTVISSGKGGGTSYTSPGRVYNDFPLPCDSRHLVLKCDVAGTVAEIIVR